MTAATSIPTHNQLPLQTFIEELCKLKRNNTHPDLADLRPYFESAVESLIELRDFADQLPDLSYGSWFLRSQYLSTRNETFEQLSIVKNKLLILAVKAQEQEDRYDILPFTAGFMVFFKEVTESPVRFQQPYILRFPLRVPEPMPAPPEEPSLDSLMEADFSDPI